VVFSGGGGNELNLPQILDVVDTVFFLDGGRGAGGTIKPLFDQLQLWVIKEWKPKQLKNVILKSAAIVA